MEYDQLFLLEEHKRIRNKGFALAGDITDLAQRASVYYHLYEESGGRNVFPLIAAHGALWGSGYFSLGTKIGRLLSLQYCFNPPKMRKKMALLNEFANAFKDINRRVCAEAYTAYHFTKLYGKTRTAELLYSEVLLGALNSCHDSQRADQEFCEQQRFQLFKAFFLWEQETIVSSAVDGAIRAFDWCVVRRLAMRPTIRFVYFGWKNGLKFRDFSSKDERIEKGINAYELACAAGLPWVEKSLRDYNLMPGAFFKNTAAYFDNLQEAIADYST